MSQENMNVMQAAFEAWNGDMDAFREMHAPDVIVRPPEGWPEPGPWVGRETVIRQWEQLRETWDADALEPVSDFIDVGDRLVVSFIWRGAGHGPELNMEVTGVYTVRKGRISGIAFFWDHSEALKAVGLAEEAMSQANVELVQRVFEGWAHGDFRAGADAISPDFEWHQLQTAVEPGAHKGAGVGGALRRIFEVYEDFSVEAEEYIDAGDNVVVVGRSRGIARGSRMELDQRFAFVWAVRDGKLTSNEIYADRDAALKAVGLSE
jgi:uncharacterized protein